MYGNKFLKATITPFGYLLAGILVGYWWFETNLIEPLNKQIDKMQHYSAAREASKHGR